MGGHSHPHAHPTATGHRLALSIAITGLFVAVEFIAGWLGHSLALLADSGHNLADVAALILSWYALRMASWPSTDRRTFGYHRAGILAALTNSIALVVIGLLILWQAIAHLRAPPPSAARGGIMIAVAAAGIVVNGIIALGLHAASRTDVNIRSAYLHMLADALSAFGVVVAGVLVLIGGWTIADPIVSLAIGLLILYSAWGTVAETTDVLLESAPKHIDVDAVSRAIARVPGVIGVHDLHVWTIGPGAVACSCHILVAERTIRAGQQVLQAVIAAVEHDFGINHTTVQVEVEGCDPNDMYCTIRPGDANHAGHGH
jgi:cobalt-zinc-cadmium efflux system protein